MKNKTKKEFIDMYFNARKNCRDLLGIKDFLIIKGDFDHKFNGEDVEFKLEQLREIIEILFKEKQDAVYGVGEK